MASRCLASRAWRGKPWRRLADHPAGVLYSPGSDRFPFASSRGGVRVTPEAQARRALKRPYAREVEKLEALVGRRGRPSVACRPCVVVGLRRPCVAVCPAWSAVLRRSSSVAECRYSRPSSSVTPAALDTAEPTGSRPRKLAPPQHVVPVAPVFVQFQALCGRSLCLRASEDHFPDARYRLAMRLS